MNKVLVFLAALGLARGSPVEQTVIFNEDGSYRFNFDTGKDAGSIVRHEERQADGTVIGRYSYEDPTGSVRVVNYRAGRQGFVATGDVGVAGAPPAQVPAQLPPEAPLQEEPHQDLQQGPVPDVPEKTIEPEKQDHSTEAPVAHPEKPDTAVPEDETVKVAIPEEPGRKREAGSPPISYTDNFYPFVAPMFGKRRLDIPDEDDKSNTDDDTDKKQDAVKPPTSYIQPFDFAHKPLPVAPVKPVPEVKPPEYFYYFPVAPQYGSPQYGSPQYGYPGSHQSQQPAIPNQYNHGPPKAWVYVPIQGFPQHNSAAPQQSPQQVPISGFPQHNAAPPTNWVLIQPHAVNYIPGQTNEAQNPDQQSGFSPIAPTKQDDDKPPVTTSPVQSGPTRSPVDLGTQVVPEQPPVVPVTENVEPGQFHGAFNRPTVHHYHFRGPSHTYGYYYQY